MPIPTLCQLFELVQTAFVTVVAPVLVTSFELIPSPLQATKTVAAIKVVAIETKIFFMLMASKRLPKNMAEAVRFELTNRSLRRRFSRPVPSTARPRFQGLYSSLRSGAFWRNLWFICSKQAYWALIMRSKAMIFNKPDDSAVPHTTTQPHTTIHSVMLSPKNNAP